MRKPPDKTQGERARRRRAGRVVAAAVAPIAASYTGTAALEARGEAQVVAKTSGVALAVLVEEGQQVRAGQVLVRLDPDRARLAGARRASRSAQAREQLPALAGSWSAQKLVSANDIDQIKYDLENARAAYDLAKLELSYTNVIAPISGVIAQRSIKPGNLVQINTPIFRIVDNSHLEGVLNVPEREMATLKVGPAGAHGGRRAAGQGRSPARSIASRRWWIRAAAPSAWSAPSTTAPELQPGHVRPHPQSIYDQRTDALTVPRIALLEDEGEPAVYVVRGGKAGARAGASWATPMARWPKSARA